MNWKRETELPRFRGVCQSLCRRAMEEVNGVQRWTQCTPESIADECDETFWTEGSNAHSTSGMTIGDIQLEAHITGWEVQDNDRS